MGGDCNGSAVGDEGGFGEEPVDLALLKIKGRSDQRHTFNSGSRSSKKRKEHQAAELQRWLEKTEEVPLISVQDSQNIKEGETVYTCGFGYFLSLNSPSLYRGYITRIIYGGVGDSSAYA